MRLVFLLGCVLISATVLCFDVEDDENKAALKNYPLKREKREAAETVGLVFQGIELAINVGRTIFEAVEYFKQEAESNRAKVIVYVINFSGWSMTSPETHISEDADIRLPRDTVINPKEMEAWTSTQTGGRSGVEGTVSWNVLSDRFCTIYWKVAHNKDNREPNGMAFGCFPKNYNGNILSEILTVMVTGTSSSNIVYRTYDRTQAILQYCDPKFCLQGMMEPGYHANVSVSVIPRKVSDAIPGITQAAIDQIIDTGNHCKVCGYEDGSSGVKCYESIFLISFALVLYNIL